MRMQKIVVVAAVAFLVTSTAFAQESRARVVRSAPLTVMPDAKRTPVRVLDPGTELLVRGEEGEFYLVQYQESPSTTRNGYVQKGSVEMVASRVMPSPAPAPAVAAPQAPARTEPEQAPAARPGLTAVARNSVVFVEASEFGQALQAALIKKKVPVLVTTNKDKADFYIEETSKLEKEGAAERVTKVLAFGAFAGNGKTYEASITMVNTEGIVMFARNVRKNNPRSAAEEFAEQLGNLIKNSR